MNLITIVLLVSFYCPCKICCGKWAGGLTSTGTWPEQKFSLACNKAWTRQGKKFFIPSFGLTECEDTGSKIQGTHVDMFVETHAEAVRLGIKKVTAYEVKLND